MVIHLVLMKVRHFSLLQINYRQNQNSSRQILLMSISLVQEHANKASSLLTSYAVDSDMPMMGQSSNNMSTHTFGNSSNIEVNSMNMSSSGNMVGMDAGGRESNIKPMAPNNSSAFISNLENGLTQLNASIKNKASPMDIMMIVRTQIHPNLLEAYSLRLE
jgi:hypothetical protein